ncbi:MAG TPA: cobalamin-dependent protein [Methanotrichaceae archaeon]|nr:cobalamin-dependent protein [Methanotrichaceae archaeon]
MMPGLLEVSQAINRQRRSLAESIVSRQYELQPELWNRFGEAGWHKSVRDAEYHLSYLAEALSASDPLLFADYIAWAKVLFAGLKFPDDALKATLECTGSALKGSLPGNMWPIVEEYIMAGIDQLDQAPAVLPTFMDDDAPLADLAREYLRALLNGERRAASDLIMDAVEGGTSIKDIYIHVFQRSQHEVGRLWQTNQLSVAQEHYCTAATQLIMSQLYPLIFATDRIGRRLVATCVGGELHEIGIRMVADFFELAGWDTYYVGANMPAESILKALSDRHADVLAISATMTFHISKVADLISRVRSSAGLKDVKILVGGYPFNASPDLWHKIGADGYARDASEAVAVASRLLDGGA